MAAKDHISWDAEVHVKDGCKDQHHARVVKELVKGQGNIIWEQENIFCQVVDA